MREIEFRGLDERLNWIFGGFYIGSTGNHIIAELVDVLPTWNDPCGDCRVNFVSVEPKTVGQYTGLKDKNGNKIFEGDVLTFDVRASFEEGSKPLNNHKGIVSIGTTETSFGPWSASYCTNLKILGNIYENPELIQS